MNQLLTDILPLLWGFFAGLVLGALLAYSSGHRKGFQEALQAKSREETSRSFAEFLNSISRAGGQSHEESE